MASNVLQRNVPYIKQQIAAAFGNSSVVVKFLCAAVITGYFLSFSETVVKHICVIPGLTLPPNFWVWTLLTFSFVQSHLVIVIIDLSVVILAGKLLEPLWGAKEMLLFYTLVNFEVAIFTTMTYLFVFLLTKEDDYLFETRIYGLAGYIAAFCVAVKQIMPDHGLIMLPFGKLRNKHIPLFMFILSILLRIAGILNKPYPIMFGFGILISWVYLRFYQKHGNGDRGDMADNFTFASFFPGKIEPFVAVLCNTVFEILVKIKVCKKPQRRYDVSSPTTITVSLPGTDRQDAERRKQLALKALNERLTKTEPASWPALDDPPSSPATPVATPTSADVPQPVPVFSKIKEETPSPAAATKLPVPDFKNTSQGENGSNG